MHAATQHAATQHPADLATVLSRLVRGALGAGPTRYVDRELSAPGATS